MIRLFKKVTPTATQDVCEFYLPQKETIKALSSRQPLTFKQVEDYIRYIRHNYFVAKVNVGVLDQFCAEYVLFAEDDKRIQMRLIEAKNQIEDSLTHGQVPNIMDALWLSSRVFVDDVDTLTRRIITKTIDNDKPSLDVQVARKNIMVAKQVSNLKGSLKELASSKSVDITF